MSGFGGKNEFDKFSDIKANYMNIILTARLSQRRKMYMISDLLVRSIFY